MSERIQNIKIQAYAKYGRGSQKKLADAIGVSQGYLYWILTGRKKSERVLKACEEHLKITCADAETASSDPQAP